MASSLKEKSYGPDWCPEGCEILCWMAKEKESSTHINVIKYVFLNESRTICGEAS